MSTSVESRDLEHTGVDTYRLVRSTSAGKLLVAVMRELLQFTGCCALAAVQEGEQGAVS